MIGLPFACVIASPMSRGHGPPGRRTWATRPCGKWMGGPPPLEVGEPMIRANDRTALRVRHRPEQIALEGPLDRTSALRASRVRFQPAEVIASRNAQLVRVDRHGCGHDGSGLLCVRHHSVSLIESCRCSSSEVEDRAAWQSCAGPPASGVRTTAGVGLGAAPSMSTSRSACFHAP